MSVAKVATGFFLPISRVNLGEYSLTMIMMMRRDIMYTGKANCIHVLVYVSSPLMKQASTPMSKLSHATNTLGKLD